MNNKTVLIAAVLTVATVLAAGLTVLPGSVQEAQANPCAEETTINIENEEVDNPDGFTVTASNAESTTGSSDNRECNFVGPVELDED
jgi:hypothetical protein